MILQASNGLNPRQSPNDSGRRSPPWRLWARALTPRLGGRRRHERAPSLAAHASTARHHVGPMLAQNKGAWGCGGFLAPHKVFRWFFFVTSDSGVVCELWGVRELSVTDSSRSIAILDFVDVYVPELLFPAWRRPPFP